MKILIVENFWLEGKKLRMSEKFLLNSFSILPSLFARQLKAITPKEYDVELVDERYNTINFDEKYNIVLINFNFSSVSRAYEIAKKFKEKKSKVVFSGWFPSVMIDEVKFYSDSILIGLNEQNWLDFLNDYKNNNIKKTYGP